MTTTISALVPLASVLLGAALTYWLNVRGRKRSRIEDLFNDAITAVAVADASKYYISNVGMPANLMETEYRDLLASISREAIEGHTRHLAEAREALARVTPYEPQLAPYYRDAEALIREPETILRLLSDARTRRL